MRKMGSKRVVICIILVLLAIVILVLLIHNNISKGRKDKEVVRKEKIVFDSSKFEYFEMMNYNEKNDQTTEYCIDLRDDMNTATINEKEYTINESSVKEIQDLLCDYSYVIESDYYWPTTEEYPAMRSLWEIEFRDASGTFNYTNSGATGYPENWDKFVEVLTKLITQQS